MHFFLSSSTAEKLDKCRRLFAALTNSQPANIQVTTHQTDGLPDRQSSSDWLPFDTVSLTPAVTSHFRHPSCARTVQWFRKRKLSTSSRSGVWFQPMTNWCIVLTILYQFVLPNVQHCDYTGCNRRNGPDFGRVFLMLNYTEKPQNTYIQSWTFWEIMASEVWNFDSCYTLTDYQIRIETGRNMWFL